MNSRSPAGARHLHVVVILLLVSLLLGNMVLIYFFSSESGEASGDRSASVTEVILEIVYPDYNELPMAEQESLTVRVHHFVRKAAHFLEYALLGWLTACLAIYLRHRFLPRMPQWLSWVLPTAFCLLYAVSDEVHQIFSGRGPRVTDVLIDLAGTVCGVCMVHGAVWLVSRIRNRLKQKAGKEATGT